MHTVNFTSAKGGQGTTTIACAFAVLASKSQVVHIVCDTDSDVWPALGAVAPTDPVSSEVAPSLTAGPIVPDNADLVVYDHGDIDADTTYLVTRACFLALRRFIANKVHADGIILITEQGRSLTARDVADCVGIPVVAEVPVDPSVTRAVDAGLLAVRPPKVLAHLLVDLITEPAH